ncbi:MAG: glycerophosphodiester phosphodiesterase, partial [Sphingobium sp.]
RLRALFDRTLALWLANPDFLACDIRDLPFRFADAASRRGLPVLSWTVRSTAQRAIAAAHADQIIFEEMA